jgi:hypothetical protein
VSAQTEPHIIRGAVHVDAQLPAIHSCPAGQVFPHEPQFDESFWKLTHVPPHKFGLGAMQVQTLATQVCPVPHGFPHEPQFDGLDVVSTQRLLQTT